MDVNQIKKRIDNVLERIDRPPVAAFDADGTLWRGDMGEAFFEYQIKKGLVPLPRDPWGHYEWLKKESSYTTAYLWLAQICAGFKLAEVRSWANSALHEIDVGVFETQQEIVRHLLQNKVQVYVVTASVKWAVEPAAEFYFGLPYESVLGIKVKEGENGLLTADADGPITWREGKAEALLARTQGVRPFFCAGNTTGDLALLETATDIGLIMASARPGEGNYATEQEMLEIAKLRGWYLHQL